MKHIVLQWTVAILSLYCGLSCSSVSSSFSLNLEEINLVQYDIKIGEDPVLIHSENEEKSVPEDFVILPMTNKHGQRYQCLVPKSKDDTINNEKSSENEFIKEGVLAEEEPELSDLEKAKKVLEPMKSQSCILRTKDWWTYEFCYGKHIRQFHMSDGKPSGPILVLGFYEKDLELEEEVHNNRLGKTEGTSSKVKRHHSQLYTNGSNCDLTRKPRSTEVRFECDPTSNVDTITQVDEPQSCKYIITVLTSKICAIPHLRPPPIRQPLKINCQPALTSEEFEKYEKILKIKQDKAEKKVAEMKSKQTQNLLKALGDEDISHIDMSTEEGLNSVEEKVAEKLATRLFGEIGNIFGGESGPKVTKIATNAKKEPVEYEEITLKSGEKQSKLISSKKKTFEAMIDRWASINENNVEQNEGPNLDPRSDLSDETEMVNELVNSMKKFSKDDLSALDELKDMLKQNIEESFEEIIDETENEMNTKMDGVKRGKAIAELYDTFKELMTKLDKAEKDINKVNEEIEQLHDTIDNKEEVIDTLKKSLDDSDEDTSETEDTTEETDAKVNIKVTNFGTAPATALKDSPSEKRVIKHLERSIKEKLSKAGLDTGGRQIEVKFITTSIPAEVFGGTENVDQDDSMSGEEAKQFQGMIYNLMVGNQEAYEDIDNQRKTEKSYHFSLSEEPNDQVDDANEETVSLEDDNIENNGKVIQNENL